MKTLGACFLLMASVLAPPAPAAPAAFAAPAAPAAADRAHDVRAGNGVPAEERTVVAGARSRDDKDAAVSAVDVQAAWRAWANLRNGLRSRLSHAARRRSAAAGVAEVRAAAREEAARQHVRVREFSLSAESSFTAVSRALDRLARLLRMRKGSPLQPIAAAEFVVEGSVDADTIQSYLRSQTASALLAKAEADALRRVVGMLLTSPPTHHTTTRAPPGRVMIDARKTLPPDRPPQSPSLPSPTDFPSLSLPPLPPPTSRVVTQEDS